uniref:Nodulin homeobox homeobox-like domain-containing protein n=1 Tax=Chenopodium quinoa TaxID=63459 RepID=A0A803MWU1_CHEQI
MVGWILDSSSILDMINMDWRDPKVGFTFIPAPQKAATICKNLCSLLSHAESLVPTFLNEEDVQLLRLFFFRLQSLIGLVDYEVNIGLSRHSKLREGNSVFPGVDDSCIINVEDITEADDGAKHDQKTSKGKAIKALAECIVETEKEIYNVETSSGSDSSTTRGQNPNEKVGDDEYTSPNEHLHRNEGGGVQQDERVESVHGEESQVRKRKRNLMNNIQLSLIERVLQDEPDIHKNIASLQSWANILSSHTALDSLESPMEDQTASAAANDHSPVSVVQREFRDKYEPKS